MTIGILSDTHDHIRNIDKALEVFRNNSAGLVLHCGDWITPATVQYTFSQCASLGLSLRGVLGNNDIIVEALLLEELLMLGNDVLVPGVLSLSIDGRKIAVVHGHEKELLSETIQGGEYDAVFTGHTHKAKVSMFGETLVANPGSVAFEMPRTKENLVTVALYDTETNSVEIVELN